MFCRVSFHQAFENYRMFKLFKNLCFYARTQLWTQVQKITMFVFSLQNIAQLFLKCLYFTIMRIYVARIAVSHQYIFFIKKKNYGNSSLETSQWYHIVQPPPLTLFKGGEVNFNYLPWRGDSENFKKGMEVCCRERSIIFIIRYYCALCKIVLCI